MTTYEITWPLRHHIELLTDRLNVLDISKDEHYALCSKIDELIKDIPILSKADQQDYFRRDNLRRLEHRYGTLNNKECAIIDEMFVKLDQLFEGEKCQN